MFKSIIVTSEDLVLNVISHMHVPVVLESRVISCKVFTAQLITATISYYVLPRNLIIATQLPLRSMGMLTVNNFQVS